MNYIDFFKKYPRQLSFGFTHAFFAALGQTYIFAVFVPEFEQAFNLTPAQSGGYYGTITLLSGFLLFYTGSLIDKINLRKFATAVVACIAIGALLMTQATNIATLLVAMFLLRHAGQGLMVHLGNVATSKYFTRNRGKGLSVVAMGVSLSAMVLPFFAAWLIASYGWQAAYAVMGLITVLACLGLSYSLFRKDEPFLHPHLTEEEQHPAFMEEEELNWGRRQLLSHPHFWMILPLVMGPGYIVTAFTFHQGQVAGMQGWSMQHIAAAFVAYGIGSFAMNFAIGPLIDKFSGNMVQKLMMVPLILSALVLYLGTHPALAYVYLGLMGIGVGWGASNMAMWAEVYGRRHVGAIKSFVGTITIIGSAAAPVVFGTMVESGWTVGETILVHVAYMVIATILAVLAPLPQNKRRKA